MLHSTQKNETMKKLISNSIILLLLISFIKLNAQSESIIVKVSDNSFLINDAEIVFPTDLATIEKILNKSDRITKTKYSEIVSWDSLGITAYKSKNSEEIKTIHFDFEIERFDFSPKNKFNGKVLINSLEMSNDSTKEDLNKIGFGADPIEIMIYDLVLDKIYMTYQLKNLTQGFRNLEIGMEY